MKSELLTKSLHLYQLLGALGLKEAITLLKQQCISKVPYSWVFFTGFLIWDALRNGNLETVC